MKPARFQYHDPTTRGEVLALLDAYEDEAKLLAGGQSLVPLLNMRLAQPAHLIDMNRLSDLSYIREEAGGLVIGALTRHCEIERSPLVRQLCPLLSEAITFVGHAPIRSRGTIGGSLAHADPAAELPAVLVGLGGSIRAASSAGERVLTSAELFLGPLQTSLSSRELLTEIWFPQAPPRSGSAFVEVSRRHGDYALAGVAVQLALHTNGTISSAQLALMGVAETPLALPQTGKLLVGERPDERIFSRVAQEITSTLDPDADLHASSEYRRSVAAVLVKRALVLATKRAQEGGGS